MVKGRAGFLLCLKREPVSFSATFRGMPVLPLEAGRACLLSGELLAGKACVFVICELSEPAGAAGTELALIV